MAVYQIPFKSYCISGESIGIRERPCVKWYFFQGIGSQHGHGHSILGERSVPYLQQVIRPTQPGISGRVISHSNPPNYLSAC